MSKPRWEVKSQSDSEVVEALMVQRGKRWIEAGSLKENADKRSEFYRYISVAPEVPVITPPQFRVRPARAHSLSWRVWAIVLLLSTAESLLGAVVSHQVWR